MAKKMLLEFLFQKHLVSGFGVRDPELYRLAP